MYLDVTSLKSLFDDSSKDDDDHPCNNPILDQKTQRLLKRKKLHHRLARMQQRPRLPVSNNHQPSKESLCLSSDTKRSESLFSNHHQAFLGMMIQESELMNDPHDDRHDDDDDDDVRSNHERPKKKNKLLMEEDVHEQEQMAQQLGLSLREYQALEAQMNNSDMGEREIAHYRQVFEKFDLDESLAISRDELRLLMREIEPNLDEEELSEVLTQADADGDGEIDFEEFIVMMKARKRILAVARGIYNGASQGQAKATTTEPRHKFQLPPLKLGPTRRRKHQNNKYKFNVRERIMSKL